jgi:hypothetical protein
MPHDRPSASRSSRKEANGANKQAFFLAAGLEK